MYIFSSFFLIFFYFFLVQNSFTYHLNDLNNPSQTLTSPLLSASSDVLAFFHLQHLGAIFEVPSMWRSVDCRKYGFTRLIPGAEVGYVLLYCTSYLYHCIWVLFHCRNLFSGSGDLISAMRNASHMPSVISPTIFPISLHSIFRNSNAFSSPKTSHR